MDLTPQVIHAHLVLVDQQGWDSSAGRALLEAVRAVVVQPIVRRSGLRGCAAEQAESSGWAAAWDALRRPSARTAENPGGMVWVAVRRAVWAEVAGARGIDRRAAAGAGPATQRTGSLVSLEAALGAGWEPEAHQRYPGAATIGPLLDELARALVAVGWEADLVGDVITGLADHVPTGGWEAVQGGRRLQCRLVSQQLGLPEWQVRRLAEVIVGGPAWPAVPALMCEHGSAVVGDGAVLLALRSTTRRWMARPGALLAGWQPLPGCAA